MRERSSKTRNPHAVALGRRGGQIGGRARAQRLSPERRREIARAAAIARWGVRRTQRRDTSPARERILTAARTEFLARGLDAARVDRIAKRANVNRRTVYDHFGSKDGLFREMLRRSVVRISQLGATASAATLGEELVIWDRAMRAHPHWIRLSLWEALSEPQDLVALDERRRFWQASVHQIERAQLAGVLPQCDASMLQLMIMGTVMFPFVLPQMTRLLTGVGPQSPEFEERHATFLRALGSWIDSAATAKPPRHS